MANQGSLIIPALDASFDNAREIYVPVQSGLLGYWWFAGAQAQATSNLATAGAGAQADVTGAPTFGGTFASFDSDNYLDSGVPETENYTWLQVLRTSSDLSTTADTITSMGTFNGSSGASIWVRNHLSSAAPAARITAQAFASTNRQATFNVVDITGWRFISARCGSGEVRARDHTAGFEGSSAFDGARAPAARTIRIGRSYSPSIIGPVDLAMTAIYDRRLSDLELASMYADTAAKLSLDGITV